MRTRVSLLAVGLCAAALVACGGNASPPVLKNTSFRPAANGDAFGYAGTMTETFVRPPISEGTIPSPNPTNSETITTAVSQAITVSTVATFQGVTNPFDFHDVETDAVNGGLKTSTVTSDNYYTYATSGGTTDITFAGSSTTTSDGVTDLDVTGTGNGLVDILPEAAGAITPANTAARTITETEPDLAQDVRTINADGTYTDTMANADGSTSTAIANADGSGSYSFPILAAVGTNSTYTVAAPAAGSIVITVTFAPQVGGTGPEPITIPVWYPLPVVLSSETLVNNGIVALPAACGVPARLTKKAPNQIVDTKTTVDPVFGELDTTTTTSYDEIGIGVACIELNDVVQDFYDLSGQTQFTLFFSGGTNPVQTTTTTETLGINAATVRGLTSVGRASELAFQAGTSRFKAQLAHRRTLRHMAFQRALIAHFKGGRI